MRGHPPAAVERYAREVALVAGRALGADLTAAYLYGSAVLGGFTAARSDVDILLVVISSVPRATLESLAFALGRDRLPSPACGLELDVLTVSAAANPERPTPFELVMSSGEDGHQVTLGSDHGPYEDGVLHLALTREAGLALLGPPPHELMRPVSCDLVLAQLIDELGWAEANASTAYQALGAARAWMYAETGRIGSKLDAAEWARGRGHDDVLDAATRFQRAETDDMPDAVPVRALVSEARDAVVEARGQPSG